MTKVKREDLKLGLHLASGYELYQVNALHARHFSVTLVYPVQRKATNYDLPYEDVERFTQPSVAQVRRAVNLPHAPYKQSLRDHKEGRGNA